MFRPFPVKIKSESRKPRISLDELFSDEESDGDCILSIPPAKKMKMAHTPGEERCRRVESFWISEDNDSVSLLA